MAKGVQRPAATPAQRLTEIAAGLHQLMRLIDSEVRIELISLLCTGPKDVGTLTRTTSFEMSTVSKGLRGLREDRLVTCCVLGSRREYALSDRIKVVVGKQMVDLNIKVPSGGRLSIGLPRGVIDSAHAQSQDVVVRHAEPLPKHASAAHRE